MVKRRALRAVKVKVGVDQHLESIADSILKQDRRANAPVRVKDKPVKGGSTRVSQKNIGSLAGRLMARAKREAEAGNGRRAAELMAQARRAVGASATSGGNSNPMWKNYDQQVGKMIIKADKELGYHAKNKTVKGKMSPTGREYSLTNNFADPQKPLSEIFRSAKTESGRSATAPRPAKVVRDVMKRRVGGTPIGFLPAFLAMAMQHLGGNKKKGS